MQNHLKCVLYDKHCYIFLATKTQRTQTLCLCGINHLFRIYSSITILFLIAYSTACVRSFTPILRKMFVR